MKTKTFFITALALVLLSFTSSANSPKKTEITPDGIRTEIINQLSTSKISLEFLSKAELRVCFRIYESGEMNIEKIESSNSQLENYFFDKLQGMKISEKHSDTEQVYWITLKYRVI